MQLLDHPPLAESFPVLTGHGAGDPMDYCLGWAENEDKALELIQASPYNTSSLPGLGDFVAGPVTITHLRVAAEDGPHLDRQGYYRWQKAFMLVYDRVNRHRD